MKLELSHKTIGHLLDGEEVTVGNVLVVAHESRDAAYDVAKVEAVGERRRSAARAIKGEDRDLRRTPFMMTAKRDGTCAANCGEPIHAGDRIQWAPKTKEARHADCA